MIDIVLQINSPFVKQLFSIEVNLPDPIIIKIDAVKIVGRVYFVSHCNLNKFNPSSYRIKRRY